MSRFTALLFLFLVVATPAVWGQSRAVSPAFSAEAASDTTQGDDIDPATGLSRSTVVRPLMGVQGVPDTRPGAAAARAPHIAVILPTASAALGRLSQAMRDGFMAAAEIGAKESPPVRLTTVDNEGPALVEACRYAQETGALLVVGGVTRDGAGALAQSGCARRILALNEVAGRRNEEVYSISLSIEQEARQAALLAVEAGLRQAIVIHTAAPISRRVQEAFEREWTRAAGEVRRIAYSGVAEEAPAIRERIAGMRADMVFLALDAGDALAVRSYISAMLPAYATSLSVNPRAEPLVNLDLQGVRYVEMPWFVQPDHPAVMIYPQPKGFSNVEQERLYALGIDAFRLALQLARGDGDKTSLDGVTGRIVLEPGNHFARHLLPAEIDGGRVIPLRPQ